MRDVQSTLKKYQPPDMQLPEQERKQRREA